MKYALCVIVMLCGMAAAQDAVVIELSKTDAEQAKQLYAAKVAADKAWDDAYKSIQDKYRDLSNGMDFSKDFKFVVPKTATSSVGGAWPYWPTNCLTLGVPTTTPNVINSPLIGSPSWSITSQ